MSPTTSIETLAKCHQKWLALAAAFPAATMLALAKQELLSAVMFTFR